MDISNLLDYVDIVTMGICLCIGYSLKTAFSKFPNQYIPLTMVIIGTAVSAITSCEINESILLRGMISGLASTGSYEMLRNLIQPKE